MTTEQTASRPTRIAHTGYVDQATPGPRVYSLPVQRRRLIAIAVYLVVSILALLLVAGHGPWTGRVLFTVSDSHGMHSGDVPVVLLWLGWSASGVAPERSGDLLWLVGSRSSASALPQASR